MAIIDVVKYDGNDEVFAWKFPSEDLRLGTQLVVKTSQAAVFVKGGIIYDVFNEGTYTLKTGNIPLLNKLTNLPFGGNSPFQAEVWFINLISKLDNKWGTPTPIQLEDPKYGIVVPIRAFGQFGMSVSDPSRFLKSLVGNMRDFSTEKIVSYFKGKIISSASTLISKKMILEGVSILEINAILDDLSNFCKEKIESEFENYGIRIENFYFISINMPEEDPSVIKLKEAKDLAAKVKITGKDLYQMDRSFDVMEKAAGNEGIVGNTMGAGMGLGLGFGMGNQMGNMSNNMNFGNNQNQQNSMPPPPPQTLKIQYYAMIDGQRTGPIEKDEVLNLINQNKINPETMVWKEGFNDWTKCSDTEINTMFPKLPPPPPK